MTWHFLNSAALWALPAVLIPLVLHFLVRKPVKLTAFGDLRLLREVIRRERPRKRLREWLILLARILALACLFFFLSRPVLKIGGNGVSGDSLAVVLLLDSSYSMQTRESGVSHWNRAVLMAGKTLSTLSEKDRSALVVFSDQVEFNSSSLAGGHRDLIKKIEDFKPGSRGTQFLPALQAAFTLLSRSDAPVKSIMLLSDAAPHGWPKDLAGLGHRIKDFDAKVQMIFSKLPSPNKNLAVSDVHVTPDFSGNRLRIAATVLNTGRDDVSRGPVSAESGSGLSGPFLKQSEALVNLKAGEKTVVNLSAPLTAGEDFLGRVRTAPDALEADNVFHFGLRSPERINVLCVEEPSGAQALTGESFFLREALLAPPSPFEISSLNLSELRRRPMTAYDVIVLVNPGHVDPDTMNLLAAYRAGGGALLAACGDRAASSGLDDLLPVKFGSILETGDMAVSVRSSGEDSAGAELAADYDWSKFRVEKIVEPILKDGAAAFLSFSDGRPLLVFGEDGRTAVWMTTLDRKWTRAASKPVFVPLMRYVIGRLSQRGAQGPFASLRVGDIGPKKTVLEEAGIFKEREYFCVNVDPRSGESDASAVHEKDLDVLFPSNPKTWVESGGKFQNQLIALLRGKDLSRFFLLAAAVFLFFEILLASRRMRAVTALLLLAPACILNGSVIPGNRFVLAQLKSGLQVSDWDPYPSVSRDILAYLQQTTSVKAAPERRVVGLDDPLLFQSPFLIFTGSGRITWTREEKENLKKYLSGGGLLFAENRIGEINGSFDDSFRSEMKALFPEKSLAVIPRDHAVFRSFYLLRAVGGRRQTRNTLEGMEVDGRVAVIYSHNDILGAWAKDLFGNFLFECSPGGEAQRWESEKLMMNIILYSVTGTYKTDSIHKPFIEDKLRN